MIITVSGREGEDLVNLNDIDKTISFWRYVMGGCKKYHFARFFAFLVPLFAWLMVPQHAVAQDIAIGGGITVIGQAINKEEYATNGSNDPDIDPDEDANGAGITYSIDIEFEKEVESVVGFIYLIGAEGDPVYDGGNADAEGGDFENNNVGVAEAWYAHSLFDELFTVTLGKIDPAGIYDGNEFANDPASQFLADVFVNNAALLIPAYTPGFNFSLEIGEIMTLSVGGFEDEGAHITGEFEHTFWIGEMALHYDLFDNAGNFRLTGWNSDVSDRFGVGLNLDQSFFDEMWGVFMRYGYVGDAEENDETDSLTEHSFSLGTQILLFDVHTLGFGWNMDKPYNDTDTLHWIESYISFELIEDVYLTFDIQSIINADYNDDSDTLVLYGFRTQANF